MLVKNTKFTGFIQEFTENTYILVVVSDPRIQPSAIELNIGCARKVFAQDQNNEIENAIETIKS